MSFRAQSSCWLSLQHKEWLSFILPMQEHYLDTEKRERKRTGSDSVFIAWTECLPLDEEPRQRLSSFICYKPGSSIQRSTFIAPGIYRHSLHDFSCRYKKARKMSHFFHVRIVEKNIQGSEHYAISRRLWAPQDQGARKASHQVHEDTQSMTLPVLSVQTGKEDVTSLPWQKEETWLRRTSGEADTMLSPGGYSASGSRRRGYVTPDWWGQTEHDLSCQYKKARKRSHQINQRTLQSNCDVQPIINAVASCTASTSTRLYLRDLSSRQTD